MKPRSTITMSARPLTARAQAAHGRAFGSLASALALITALPATSCGASGDGEGTPIVVESVEVGGLVAVDVQQSTFVRGFKFVNPASGRAGPLLPLHVTNDVPTYAHRGPIAFSPDGVHVVFATTEDGLPVWTYGRLELDDDGAPVYLEERRFDPVIGSEVVQFNAAADRFYTARGWYDPTSGRSHECPPVEGREAPAVIALPDGRHHLFVCDDVAWLYHDHERLGPVDGIGTLMHFSPDGQVVLDLGERVFHVADRASRFYDHVGFFGRLLTPDDPRREPVIDAFNRISFYGLHGFGETIFNGCNEEDIDIERDPLVTEYEVETWARGDGSTPSVTRGAFDRSLLEMPDRYDGGWAVPYGRSADGTQLVMGLALWRLEVVRVDDGCRTVVPYTTRVVKVDLASNAHTVVTSGELGEGALIPFREGSRRSPRLDQHWPFGQVPEAMAVELWPGLLLLPTQAGGFWGLGADGESAAFPDDGTLPSPDGRMLLGAKKDGPNGNGPLCATRTLVGQTPRCIEALEVREPWAVGGHNVPGIKRLSEQATVVHVQPLAATDGQEIHVWGHGFGDRPGRLTVGEREVPPTGLVSWSDTHVVFTMSEAVGTGRVLVEGPNGVGRDARPFAVLRTAKIPTPWRDTELGPVTWQQGVRRFPFSGAADTKLSGLPEEVPVADAEGYWLYRRTPVEEASERFVSATRQSWFRQYEERREPGLAPLIDGWQVVGGGAERDGFDHYEQAGPLLLEVGHGSTLRRDPHGAFLERNVAELGASLPASNWGMPSHPFVEEGGAILAVHPPATPSLVRITDFRKSGATEVPVRDEAFTKVLPLGMAHVARLGEVILIVGRAETSLTTSAWMWSTDAGTTFGAPRSEPERGRLGQVVAVESGPRTGFLTLELDRFGLVISMAHIGLDGTPSWDVLPAPPGTAEHLRLYGDGPRVYAYAPDGPTLSWLDTADTEPTWRNLGPPDGVLVSAFWDRTARRLLLATDRDVFASPLGAPPNLEALIRPELPFAHPAVRGVGAMSDGTLVVRVTLVDDDDAPHPIQGLMVRPADNNRSSD